MDASSQLKKYNSTSFENLKGIQPYQHSQNTLQKLKTEKLKDIDKKKRKSKTDFMFISTSGQLESFTITHFSHDENNSLKIQMNQARNRD